MTTTNFSSPRPKKPFELTPNSDYLLLRIQLVTTAEGRFAATFIHAPVYSIYVTSKLG